MKQELPSVAEHSDVIARMSVPLGVAVLSALFSAAAPALALLPPVALAALEMRDRAAKAIIEKQLRAGNTIDLTEDQVAAFVPMGFRYMEAARRGEYDHNLRLLASYLTAELKLDAPQPGSFLDMSRRLEGLSRVSLQAAAGIAFWISKKETEGIGPRQVNITAKLLSDANEMRLPMVYFDAAGALSDLMGRGFLYQTDGGIAPGEFYKPTQAMFDLLEKAIAIADPVGEVVS